MGFYLRRIPTLFQKIWPNHVWHIPNSNNLIYLTFDDGPNSEATGVVLNVLKEHDATATFFCLGENAEKHPSLINEILSNGHAIANHGYQHVDGWKVGRNDYIENIKKGERLLSEFVKNDELLFRPPYGHFRQGHPSVLWSLMSGDFDINQSREECLSILVTQIKVGDIVVFHDNTKSVQKLKWVLPKFLAHCKKVGLGFDILVKSS